MVTIPETCRERFLPLDDPDLAVLTAMGLRNAGISELTRGYYNGRLRPADSMLIWTCSGRACLEHEAGSLQLEPGSMVVCGPGESCHFWPEACPWRLAWAYCQRGLDGGRKQPRGIELLDYDDAQRVYTVLAELIEACHRPSSEHLSAPYRRRLAEAFAVWLERAGMALQQETGDQEQQRLEHLLQALRSDPGRAWRLTDMASVLSTSPSGLQRLLRRQLGESPHRLLVHLRMEQAARLLRQSDYPLSTIATRLGYADAFVFSAAFKRYHGCSPRVWRQQAEVGA